MLRYAAGFVLTFLGIAMWYLLAWYWGFWSERGRSAARRNREGV